MKQYIFDDIELADNTENDNTFRVDYDYDKQQFEATENVESGTPRVWFYEFTDTEENIVNNHKQEILEYCGFTKTDMINRRDVFLHGKYVRLVK
jgi:hypothetical protein